MTFSRNYSNNPADMSEQKEGERGWEEELRRQCEIRKLDLVSVRYLVEEVLERELEAQRREMIEKIKNFPYPKVKWIDPIVISIIMLIKNHE